MRVSDASEVVFQGSLSFSIVVRYNSRFPSMKLGFIEYKNYIVFL